MIFKLLKQNKDMPGQKKLKNFNRLLFIVVIALAFLAGYYQSALQIEKLKFARYEDMFVRVRGQLGREEMQRLIDQSYESGTPNL